ncbi:MAG: hypothetical protein ACPGWR_12355 [Ardenticatenaceae bacterium]
MSHIPDPLTKHNDVLIDSIQSILLSKERQRIQVLEQEVERRHYQHKVEVELLQEYIRDLLAQQLELQEVVRASKAQLDDLQSHLGILQNKKTKDDQGLLARITPMMNEIIRQTIHESPEEMAEAIAPVMGESIGHQIRNQPEQIVAAIGPIMGELIGHQIRNQPEQIVAAIGPIMAQLIEFQIIEAQDKIAQAMAPVIGESIRLQIQNQREDIAEAIGPVMGESIRVQIREQRKDLVEALYPIIGQTVHLSIAEFVRGLQRNIDARLEGTFGSQSLVRALIAILRGVPLAELAVRDALPFTVLDLFLIQSKSGLLLADYHPERVNAKDSDLISGMLSAIRNFAKDSFGKAQEEELEEIQYGDQRIIIQYAPAAYLAVVIDGIEPSGFRAQLHSFVSELNVRHGGAFRKYDGDPSILPDLRVKLARFVTQTRLEAAEAEETIPRFSAARASFAVVLLIGFFCVFFPIMATVLPASSANTLPKETLLSEQATQDASSVLNQDQALVPTNNSEVVVVSQLKGAVVEPTNTLAPTVTLIKRTIPSPVQKSRLTTEGTKAPIQGTKAPIESTKAATQSPKASRAMTGGHIWVRFTPDIEAERQLILLANTPVTVLAYSGNWVEIQWLWLGKSESGWIPKEWIKQMVWSTPLPRSQIYPQE